MAALAPRTSTPQSTDELSGPRTGQRCELGTCAEAVRDLDLLTVGLPDDVWPGSNLPQRSRSDVGLGSRDDIGDFIRFARDTGLGRLLLRKPTELVAVEARTKTPFYC